MELWHPACWDERNAPGARTARRVARIRATLPPPSMTVVANRRPRGLAIVAAASALCAGLLALRLADASTVPPDALANADVADVEPITVSAALGAWERAPALSELYPVPKREGRPLDQTFSSLSTWTHPVSGSTEPVPTFHSRLFGSERAGIERRECGAGHCGVDLDGPRGRGIVSVAAGVVVRVERKEKGSDGRSGRYVRLQHDDGSFTSYMHLDRVADLEVGDQVAAGTYVGTLGASGIVNAAPHLHFSLEIPRTTGPGQRGDHANTRYVDPSPFLARATIVGRVERKRVRKPAS